MTFPVKFIQRENVFLVGFASSAQSVKTDFSESLKIIEIDNAAIDGIISRNIAGEYINDRVTFVGYDAFRYCGKLTSVSLPNVTSIETRAFANCSRLKYADLPNLRSVGDQPFYSCTALERVNFPLLKSIGYRAFYGCSALAEVVLPSVVSIGSTGTFHNCSSIVRLVLSAPAVVTLSNTNAFTGSAVAKGTGYVYVPAGLVDQYKVAANWSAYASQIRSMEELE